MMKDDNNLSLKQIIEKPQFIRDTPLDLVFKKLDNILSRLDSINKNQSLYERLEIEDNATFVEKITDLLLDIHQETLKLQRADIVIRREKMVPISLQDLKSLEILIHLIIIFGIDANLPSTMKLPKDLKLTKDTKKYVWLERRHVDHAPHHGTLELIVEKLCPIFWKSEKKEDYIRNVLLNGPLYTSMLQVIILQYLSGNSIEKMSCFENFEALQQTYELFNIYTLFVREMKLANIREFVLDKLSTLPIRRSNGLLSLIDFVTGTREDEKIDLDKVGRVTQILLTKPKSLSRVSYFSKLFEQVYSELSHINRPIVMSCLNNLTAAFFLKNHRIVTDFLFRKIYSVLFNIPLKNHSSTELNNMINVLISLTKNSSVDFINSLVNGPENDSFYLHLWTYTLFLKKYQKIQPQVVDGRNDKPIEEQTNYYQVILSLIKSFVLVTGDFEIVNTLSLNMVNFRHEKWVYSIDFETQLPYISIDNNKDNVNQELNLDVPNEGNVTQFFQDIDLSLGVFIELLKSINVDDITEKVFLSVLSRWTRRFNLRSKNETFKEDASDNVMVLIDMKTMEALHNEFESNIIQKPGNILKMINELLDFLENESFEDQSPDGDSDDEDRDTEQQADEVKNSFDVLMDLLRTILENTTAMELLRFEDILVKIQRQLEAYNDNKCNPLYSRLKDVLDSKTNQGNNLSEELDNNRSLFNQAIAYINDPSEPVKVQGLKILSTLSQKKSTVIENGRVLPFYIQCLQHTDPFVYLNAIKHITELCQIEGKETIPALLKIFLNKEKRYKLDDTLKIGEVLINYIQIENELFEGTIASSIIDTCIELVRQYEKVDNKIRMSAVSILGVSLDANLKGCKSRIRDILDCAIGILQLEKNDSNESNSFLVRRAATRLIHDSLQSDEFGKVPEGYNFKQMMTLLNYTSLTDSDPLVREQADTILIELRDLFI